PGQPVHRPGPGRPRSDTAPIPARLRPDSRQLRNPETDPFSATGQLATLDGVQRTQTIGPDAEPGHLYHLRLLVRCDLTRAESAIWRHAVFEIGSRSVSGAGRRPVRE